MIRSGEKLVLAQFLMLLITASSVVASPSTGLDSPSAVAFIDSSVLAVSVVVPADSHLADIGREMFSSVTPAAASGQASGSANSLPAVPATAMMLLVGFLCVTLVKDRKQWCLLAVAVFTVGQMSLLSLPRLTKSLCRGISSGHQHDTDAALVCLLKNTDRPRYDIEGTFYIALLRHLSGIPLAGSLSQIRTASSLCNQLDKYERENDRPQFAADLSSRLIYAYRCVTVKVRQFVCFTPAFIFSNLSRGPPVLS